MKNKAVEEIQKDLFELSEESYREFSSKLIPNVNKENILGIRTPMLRKYAKQIKNFEVKNLFLYSLPHKYLEENSLHMFLLEDMSEEPEVIIDYLNEFLPYVDNWATCDSYKAKKLIKEPELFKNAILNWLDGNSTYEIRFGIVMSLKVLLGDNFSKKAFDKIVNIESKEFYINIAIAWYLCEAVIKNYDEAINIIQKGLLNKWIHNKAIQKCRESYRVTEEQKDYLKGLKK
ncbi:MAG TPA: DNA alkylation repair protein [Anaerovoracaceae bacterium]|nr:DNA alkylation repair protein [Anaerovoracaceae bacterium]